MVMSDMSSPSCMTVEGVESVGSRLFSDAAAPTAVDRAVPEDGAVLRRTEIVIISPRKDRHQNEKRNEPE